MRGHCSLCGTPQMDSEAGLCLYVNDEAVAVYYWHYFGTFCRGFGWYYAGSFCLAVRQRRILKLQL